MKTIIKKLLAHYWLVYPVLILKMFIYYWQTKRLDMLSIYDVPLLSLLFLLCVFEAFSFKESKPRRYGFYIVYTLITLIMLADAAYSSYFGKYVSVESAITIGMYPDMEREKMINAGNSSLEGAQKLLLNKELLADIDQILEEMTYIQFAEVDDFLEQMVAAQALPHTDYKKYPTVMEKLKKRQNICFY